MNSKQNRKLHLMTLALAGTLTIGCGGDPLTGPPNSSDNNTSTNNTSTNNTSTNNTSTNNTSTNNTSTNNTSTNNVDPRGSVTFAEPTDATVYTNGDLTLTIAPEGDAQDIELMLDEEQVITTFDETLEYVWDTSSLVEGTYEIDLRFTLAGESRRWADDDKTVVVDRTAPTIASKLPEADSTDASSDATVQFTFDEAMDPATITSDTVLLEVSTNAAVAYTAELQADGMTVELTFDRDTVELPYRATITVDGAADLAGNTTTAEWSHDVAAWTGTSFADGFIDLHLVEEGGQQFVFGHKNASPDEIVVLKHTDAVGWVEVASQEMAQIYDFDIKHMGEKVYVAALRRSTILNTSYKVASLYTFDTTTENFSLVGGTVLGGDSADGAIALDIRPIGNGSATAGGIAAVTQGQLMVFSWLNDDYSAETNILNPIDSYDYIRDESLSVHMKADAFPEVIFARCANNSNPCVNTIIEQMELTQSGWVENPGVLKTTLSPVYSNDCDEFVNFDAEYIGDTASLLFAYESRCDNLKPFVELVEGDGATWSDVLSTANLLDTLPNAGTEPYSTDIAIDANDQRWALVATNTEILVARVGTDVEWMGEVAAELDTNAILPSKKLLNARIQIGADGNPVVLFRYSNQTHVYRVN